MEIKTAKKIFKNLQEELIISVVRKIGRKQQHISANG
jgi:hypothetical protein